MCNINCLLDYYIVKMLSFWVLPIKSASNQSLLRFRLKRRQLTRFWNRFSVDAILILLGFSCVVVLTLIFCLSAVLLSSLSLYVCVFAIIICLAPPTLPCFLSHWAAWNRGIPQPLPSPSLRRCTELLEQPSLWAKRITSCGLSAFNVNFLLYCYRSSLTKSENLVKSYFFGFHELFSHDVSL